MALRGVGVASGDFVFFDGGGIRSALMGNLSLIRAEGRLALGSSLQLATLTKEYSSASAACHLLSG